MTTILAPMTTRVVEESSAIKKATPDHPIQKVLADRWSPYGFSERPVLEADLCALFEAARWAPSSYNEQPWNYFIATKKTPAEFERLLTCLVPANQTWAKTAPVLVLCVVSSRFLKTGKENRAAVHDLGLAAGNLVTEATSRELSVHQMIGILPDVARGLFLIPAHHEAWTAMAIGYKAQADELVDGFSERDLVPRQRKPLSSFLFDGTWGNPSFLTPPAPVRIIKVQSTETISSG